MILPWWIKALVAAGLLLLAAAAVHYYNETMREQGREQVRAEWREAVRIAQRAEDIRAAQRREKDKEAEDATAAALSRLAADAAGNARSADRLQRRADDLLAAARRQQAQCAAAVAAAQGQQGADPAGMLADMRRRLDEAAGRVGQYADALRIAGAGCEARFDALTESQLSPPLAPTGAP